MNDIFKENTLNAIIFKLQMTRIVDSKVHKKHIKYSKCNSVEDTSNLLNSDNLKEAITRLCNVLLICNFTVIADPKVAE